MMRNMLGHLTYGFRIQEAWRLTAAAVSGMIIVLAVLGAQHFWRTSGPPVKSITIPGEEAVIEGVNVTVPLDEVRLHSICGAAHSDRRFVHYPSGHEFNTADPIIDGYMPIPGARLPSIPNSRSAFPLFLTLPRPLPSIPGGRWFYEAAITDNCNLLERILGPENSAETPPIPVKILR